MPRPIANAKPSNTNTTFSIMRRPYPIQIARLDVQPIVAGEGARVCPAPDTWGRLPWWFGPGSAPLVSSGSAAIDAEIRLT